MHIPDNYLSPSTCIVVGAVMIPVWLKCSKDVKEKISKKRIPLIGIAAAFSFLVMMFNIPLPGGTTGHAVGGGLIALLLGPSAACLAMTTVLFIQALFFGDGGILAFGANAFIMAFILPFSTYFIFEILDSYIFKEKAKRISILISSYIGLNLAALATAILFGIQPILFKDLGGIPLYCPYPLNVSIPAMMIPHILVVGFLEALLTVGIYSFIERTSPGFIIGEERVNFRGLYGGLLTIVLLTPLGLLASGTAWGEWGVDEIYNLTQNGNKLGYTPKGMLKGISFEAVMPDYTILGTNEILGYILSALSGIAIILILIKIINIRKKSHEN